MNAYDLHIGNGSRDIFRWSPSSGVVESIDLEVCGGGQRISNLNVVVWDKDDKNAVWPIANAMPDPAFQDLPVKLFLAGTRERAPFEAFRGLVTSIEPAFPGPSSTSIVCHDESIKLRRRALVRTMTNATSVQVAKTIAKEYGLPVDESDISALRRTLIKQKASHISMSGVGRGALSDWSFIQRTLAVDGLELAIVKGSMVIRERATTLYTRPGASPTTPTFQRGDDWVLTFRPRIEHVGVPGKTGQYIQGVPGGNKGAMQSLQGDELATANAQKAGATTHRTLPQGAASGHAGAHTETRQVRDGEQERKRKDTATIECRLMPDLLLTHYVTVSGWGAKFDGRWDIERIHHSLASSGHAVTSLSVVRPAPKSSSTQAAKGLPAVPGGSTL